MISADYTRDLFLAESDARIVMLVIDGLGGLPHPDTGLSELETARLPNLDALCARGSTGLISPLGPGFTPGSGPAHLALFGYDPWTTTIGRGALSGLGLGLDFQPGDVAARLNFCTVDDDGKVTDRRAGRIATEVCVELCALLKSVSIPAVEVTVAPEMEYRAAVIFRGEGLCDGVTDSDPQVTDQRPLPLRGATAADRRMVEVAEEFLQQAGRILADQSPANMVLIRGFGRYPEVPPMQEVYGLNPVGIAGYPMYRGIASVVGMDTPETDWDVDAELDLLQRRWRANADEDFYYVHVKKTDSAGEDGDFDKKVHLLEEIDARIPRILELEPEVLVVTGDHSTPSVMGSHSWHPVPTVIASDHGIPLPGAQLTERSCAAGTLGQIPSSALMALLLAHAGRLAKFGA
jgi:2,3-bisphosphoglycerate-independent phosphoglycerate mutase